MRRVALLCILALFGCPEATDPNGDADGDGSITAIDCDDGNAAVFPGATEACNAVDDDCDGDVDEGSIGQRWPDGDGDGYGSGENPASGCPSDGWAGAGGDCDDEDEAIHPGATEGCNGVDNDCDGAKESELTTWFVDADGDSFGDDASGVETCEPAAGMVKVGGDCRDDDAAIHPHQAESCNGVDDDCDGQADLGYETTWHSDDDGDGYGSPLVFATTCTPQSGWVLDDSDCRPTDPAAFPGAPEVCNGVDDSCDGVVDEGFDLDGDGFLDLVCPNGTDCDDSE